MESGNKIAILTLKLSQPLGVIVTIKENFNVPKDEAICLKLAIFHVEMSNLPNSAWGRSVNQRKKPFLS